MDKVALERYMIILWIVAGLVLVLSPFLFLWLGSSGFWALPAEYCQLPVEGNADEELSSSLVRSCKPPQLLALEFGFFQIETHPCVFLLPLSFSDKVICSNVASWGE